MCSGVGRQLLPWFGLRIASRLTAGCARCVSVVRYKRTYTEPLLNARFGIEAYPQVRQATAAPASPPGFPAPPVVDTLHLSGGACGILCVCVYRQTSYYGSPSLFL
jgi:hypothetical protein